MADNTIDANHFPLTPSPFYGDVLLMSLLRRLTIAEQTAAHLRTGLERRSVKHLRRRVS